MSSGPLNLSDATEARSTMSFVNAGTLSRMAFSMTVLLLVGSCVEAELIWIEAEKPTQSSMHRHPFWYDMVKRDQLSGGDFISNWSEEPGEATYNFNGSSKGEYEFWVRANPVATKLSYRLNSSSWTKIAMDSSQQEPMNIAQDGKIDLRFLAWVKVGKVSLLQGRNSLTFKMDSENNNHGSLDCFVFTTETFRPNGKLKPGEQPPSSPQEKGWFAFDPKADQLRASAQLNLRFLNESFAGEHGFIKAKGDRFVHSKSEEPVRFWAVNGPSSKELDSLKLEAKMLAKRGVNLVRVHHPYFDKSGNVDLKEIDHAHDIVEALKAEGIYTHFSIYFPLWLDPKPETPWLKGYDGKKHAFAALFFNPDFQKQYQEWWKALMIRPSPRTGKRLIDDPAVAGLEIINEDSYFFWTFNAENIPDTQLKLIETQFGTWAKGRYGSISDAIKAWGETTIARDNVKEGRLGFRPLWNMANERIARDKDTARFLFASQRNFYRDTITFLRDLGFQGMMTASNWTTANPEYLGPIEKYSYTVGDFIDRHGYFACKQQGESAEWSIRDGHTYIDRSALRFDPEEQGKPKAFVHPGMDPSYDNKPSMISETTWNRPNRYRSEAPLYFAAYGALQGSDAIVHFALDSANWSVKPGYFMQPWTLMSPAMMGQFPAAALIFRRGLIQPGEMLADIKLGVNDILDLKGTPLPQDATFDELRLKDVPTGNVVKPGQVIDPLIHFAGRTNVSFTTTTTQPTLKSLSKLIDRKKQRVTSSTGELSLEYGKGLLTINTPQAQGVSGALSLAKQSELRDIVIQSTLDLGHIVAVSLDDKPLDTSAKVLLQVMSEEKATDFKSEPVGKGVLKIKSIGHDPWLVRNIEGVVKFRRRDSKSLKVQALDANGEAVHDVGNASEIKLEPSTLYYLITK